MIPESGNLVKLKVETELPLHFVVTLTRHHALERILLT